MIQSTRIVGIVYGCILVMTLGGLVACTSVSDEEKATKQGLLFLNSGHLDQAQQMFERAVELNEGYMVAYMHLAQVHQAQLEMASAVAVLDRAMEIDPNDRHIYTRKANIQFDMDDAEGMRTTVNALNEQFGVTAGGLVLEGRVAELEHDWTAAQNAFQAAVEMEAKYIDGYWGLLRVSLAQEDLEQARAALQQILAIEPDNLTAAVQLSLLKAQDGEEEAAEEQLKGLLVQHEGNVIVLAALADLALRAQDLQKAREYAQQVLAVHAANPTANFVVGAALLQERKYGEAQRYLELAYRGMPTDPRVGQALRVAREGASPVRTVRELSERFEQEPGNGPLALDIAEMYLRMSWLAEAVQASATAFAIMPEDRRAATVRLIALTATQQNDEAREVLERRPPAEHEALLRAIQAHLDDDRTLTRQMMDRALVDDALDPWVHYMDAVFSLAEGNPRQAVTSYDHCIDMEQSMTIALIDKARLYEALGMINPALGTLGQALQVTPDDWRLRLRIASLLDKRGLAANAETYIRSVLEKDEDNVVARMALAQHYARHHNHVKAIDEFRRLLSQRPDSMGLRVQLANALCVGEQVPSGIGMFREVLREQPDLLPVRVSLGLALAAQDQFDEAAEHLETVLSASPSLAQASVQLAMVRQMQGRFDESMRILENLEAGGIARDDLAQQLFVLHLARGDYEKASITIEDSTSSQDYKALARMMIGTSSQHEYDPSRLSLGRALAGAGWIQTAIRHYDRLIAQQPQNAIAHTAVGELKLRINDPEGALNAFQVGLNMFSDSAYLQRRTGEILMMLRQDDAAMRHMQRAVEIDPENATAWINIAGLNQRRGATDEVKRNYLRVIELNPTDAIALNNLAYLLAENKPDRQEALGLARRAAELRPNDGSIRDTLGWIHMLLGDDATQPTDKERHFQQAEEHLTAALALMPDHPVTTLHYAQILERLGRFEQAVPMYQRVQRIDAKSDEATIAENAINRLKQRGHY